MTALAGSGCGGTAAKNAPAAQLSAAAVEMTATPVAALALCREMMIMRLVCPRRVPATGQPGRPSGLFAYCGAHPNGALVPLASDRCRDGEWSYIAGGPSPPGATGKNASWTMAPGPPWFVHVDISASRDHPECEWPHEQHSDLVSDVLLNHPGTRAMSLGWLRWYGESGQLVLAPAYPGGGEVGGHLEFCFSAEHVYYAVTLHSWTSILRFNANGANKQITLYRGPSLPRVIATLKSIVRSAKS